MNREAQSIVTALLGLLLVAITATGRYTAYVKPGFAPLLWIGGGLLVVVGVWSLVHSLLTGSPSAARSGAGGHDGHDHGPDHGDGHDGHDHDRSKAPWLVLAPILVLLVAAPPALGAASLEQYSGSQALSSVDPTAGGGKWARDDDGTPVMTFDPLPSGTAPSLTLHEFILRAHYDPEESVARTPVTVTGFVAPPGRGYDQGWSLARLTIACCAADAAALRVYVPEDTELPDDTWVRAVVRAVPGTGNDDNHWVPAVEVVSLTVVERPADPYE